MPELHEVRAYLAQHPNTSFKEVATHFKSTDQEMQTIWFILGLEAASKTLQEDDMMKADEATAWADMVSMLEALDHALDDLGPILATVQDRYDSGRYQTAYLDAVTLVTQLMHRARKMTWRKSEAE